MVNKYLMSDHSMQETVQHIGSNGSMRESERERGGTLQRVTDG